MGIEAPAASGTTRRWLIVLVCLGTVITGFFDRISIAVLFGNKDFTTTIGTGFNPALLGTLMTAFLIPYALSAFFLSFTGDVYGPRRMLGCAAVIWGGLMLFIGAASSYTMMIVCRALLGITEGPQFSWFMKIVKRWFPAREHGRANAVWLLGSPLGSAVGFPLSIWLVATFGWRASFYVLGALTLVVMAPLIVIFVRDWPPNVSAKAKKAETGSRGFRADCGVFLRNWQFWLLVLYDCGLVIFLWGLNSWLPTYLQRARHFELTQLGIFSSLPFMLMFLGVASSGVITDWLGRRAIICFVGLVGTGVLVYAATISANPYVAATMIALSAGSWGVALPAFFSLLLSVLPQSVTSSGTGVCNGITNFIGALAPLIMGWLIGLTGNFNAGLMVLVWGSIICACAILPLVRRY